MAGERQFGSRCERHSHLDLAAKPDSGEPNNVSCWRSADGEDTSVSWWRSADSEDTMRKLVPKYRAPQVRRSLMLNRNKVVRTLCVSTKPKRRILDRNSAGVRPKY